MCDGEIELSDRAKSLWGKTNRVDDTEWLPLYVHMADSAAMAVRIWDTWVPYGTKSIISRDLGNDDDLARKLMIFLAGVHDIGKATPVFQAKPISFGPDAESLAWKPEQAGLPMIAGLRDTSHPTHPIAGQVILERYFSLVHKWGERESRQYACVVGGHHGTPPDKSKLESARLGKTESGLDSEVWTTTQNELIEFIAGTVGIGDEEWKLLSKKRFSVQSAVLATGLVIIADWIASNSDADMFPLVRGCILCGTMMSHSAWQSENTMTFSHGQGYKEERNAHGRVCNCHMRGSRRIYHHPAKIFSRLDSGCPKARSRVLFKNKLFVLLVIQTLWDC